VVRSFRVEGRASRLPSPGTQVESLMDKKDNLLDQLAVQKLDRDGRWYVLPVDQIAYIFLGSAAALRSVHAAWLRDTHLASGDVYVRTLRGVTARSDFRQFSDIEARLDRRHFMVVNRALMANLRRITELDLKGKIKQVGIVINNETEWLSVSRRPLEPLLRRLGFSKRRAVLTKNLQASPVRQGQNR
jgi:hypothetical protein